LIAFILYLGSMIFGVLFFGAIHAWVYTIVFLGVIVASLLLIRGEIVNESGVRSLRWVKTDMSPLFFGFLIFLVLQMFPMPDGLLVFLSPEAKIDGDMSLPAATTLGGIPFSHPWYTLAPYIFPVRSSLIIWLVYGLFFFGLIRTLNSRKRIETAIIVILLAGCFESLYGIIQIFSGYHHIWWFEVADLKAVSGTYLNRNHFAGFMEMGIILAIAYAGALAEKDSHRRTPVIRSRRLRNRILKYLSGDEGYPRRFLIIFSGVVMGIGLLLSASRGGIISTAGALLIMGLFFIFRASHRRKGFIILILFFMTLGYGIYIGLDYTLGRFEFFDRDMEARMAMTEKAVGLYKDFLFAGTGIGSFEYSYARYQDPVHLNSFINYAHNDWIQFLAEGGTIVALLLLTGMGWFIFRTLRNWRERNEDFAVCLGLAPFAALFALGIHSVSDFNLHRPANMMLLIAVLAIGTAALHPGRHHRDGMQYGLRLIPMRKGGIVLIVFTVGLILWSGVWIFRQFVAEAHCSTEVNPTLNLDQNPPADEVRGAIAWNPINARYHFKLAQALMAERDRLMQLPEPDREHWVRSHAPIIAALERAVRLNPLNAEYHVRLGWEYSYLWDRPDHWSRWFPAADLSMDRAAHMAGNWAEYPRLHVDMGNYWTMRSKSFSAGDPQGEVAWIKGVWHYQKAMALDKRKELREEIIRYVRGFHTDPGRFKDLQ